MRLRQQPPDPDREPARVHATRKWASRPRGGFFLGFPPRASKVDRGKDHDAYHLPREGQQAAPRNPRLQIARRERSAAPEQTVRVRIRKTGRAVQDPGLITRRNQPVSLCRWSLGGITTSSTTAGGLRMDL